MAPSELQSQVRTFAFDFTSSFSFSSELWLPEVRVENLVKIDRLELREGQAELRVRGDKTINLIHRLRVRIRCQMELRMFPHDQQVKSFEDSFLFCEVFCIGLLLVR